MRNSRQTRAAGTRFETREADGEKYIEGYFSVFDGLYQIYKDATESIDRHAFDETLANEDDVRALVNHDTTLVLGRTAAKTAELWTDDHGLYGRIRINQKDTDALNLYHRVQRGDVSQCSFGFDILDEKTEVREDGSVHWTILRVKLYEVSCCTFPAYETTSISARAEDYKEIKRRHAEAWREKMKARLKPNGAQTGNHRQKAAGAAKPA